ncbi:MAG TPA: nuclear transport factor 2 family protein [Thermoanaerobaculia bacterium]|nr:nuclear transport factor 2 family protein [Thermoanaerobaculia bacterium]
MNAFLGLFLFALLSDRPAIEHVLDDFHKAASEADESRYFGHMAPDAVFIGTDATERWTVSAFRDYAHPHFAAGKGWTYTPRDRHVVVHGDVAWFDELLDNAKYGECRGTGVLRKDGGRWKIVQYSLSMPVPNEKAADVVKIIRSR